MKYNIIYKTVNLINNKIYVGKHQTNDLNDNYLGSGIIIKNAIKKYGKENFKREILEISDDINLNKREIYWIAFLDSRNTSIGYNLNSGGTGFSCGIDNPMIKNKTLVKKHTDRMITNNPMKNPLIASKVSKALKGKYDGASNPMHGIKKMGVDNPMYGKHHSSETKHKLRMAHGTKVVIHNTIYLSINSASKKLKLNRSTIKKRCESNKFNSYQYLKKG